MCQSGSRRLTRSSAAALTVSTVGKHRASIERSLVLLIGRILLGWGRGFCTLRHRADVFVEWFAGGFHQDAPAHFQVQRGTEPRAVVPVGTTLVGSECCLGGLSRVNCEVEAHF